MSRRYGRSWLVMTAFLVFYASLDAQDKPPNAIAPSQASSEDTALRVLVEQYFTAYAKKDLRGMVALWNASSPHLSALRKETSEFFSSNEDIKLTHLTIERLTLADQTANLRVAFELSAVDTKTRQPATDLGPTVRTVDCVRQAGLWRVWRDVDTVDDLAELLIAAKSEAYKYRRCKTGPWSTGRSGKQLYESAEDCRSNPVQAGDCKTHYEFGGSAF